MFEKDLAHFVLDSIFKRLKFDYSPSETVSIQKIKNKNYFPNDCVFLEIRLTHGNQLSPNVTRKKVSKKVSNGISKFVQINLKHLL